MRQFPPNCNESFLNTLCTFHVNIRPSKSTHIDVTTTLHRSKVVPNEDAPLFPFPADMMSGSGEFSFENSLAKRKISIRAWKRMELACDYVNDVSPSCIKEAACEQPVCIVS